MSITNKLKRWVHHKQRERLYDLPLNTGAGFMTLKDPVGNRKTALFIWNATTQYLYNVEEDGAVQIPSIALGGTYGAGACGGRWLWSNTLTATGGTSTSLTLTTNINNLCIGRKIRFLTGANAGKYATVEDLRFIPGGSHTVTFTGVGLSAVSNGDTFKIDTGLYYIVSAGNLTTAGAFKSYDPLTGLNTSLSGTNLSTARAIDGRLVGTPSYVGEYANGTATAGASTTITNSAKNWTTNQWANYQIEITAGTGAGQIRSIASNTSTAITVSTAWTVTPDATSVYSIQANDDYLYLMGNNAVTLYRYSISANTWTVITPTVARPAGLNTGGGANWINKSGNALRADENNILDGRFIYSFRGGATAVLDRYDIALNRWDVINYINAGETFTTGSSYDADGGKLYIRKDATNRFFYYDVVGNVLMPFTRNLTPDSTAVVGDKLFSVTIEHGGDSVSWIYTIQNSGVIFYRMLII